MRAFVYPGQGSQVRGMGKELFDQVPQYAAVEQQVDELLGYSMRALCLDDPANRLKQTQYTQPSLYVVNALYHYKALSQGARPDFVAGHSLGEYNALWAAGVFDFITGLRLVKKRGELMARAPNGGMAAIIGLDAERIVKILKDCGANGIEFANYNSPSQIVISGPAEDIQRLGPTFEAAGAGMYVPLQVSAAFHSRYMAAAAREFADFLAPMSFSAPQLPVVSNVTAQPYSKLNASEAVKASLVEQITHPVRWTQSVRYLLSQRVTDFMEVGPGNVLIRLIQQIRP